MTNMYRCEGCNQAYPKKIPNFCVKCGNKLQDQKISQPMTSTEQVTPSIVEKPQPKLSSLKYPKNIVRYPTREFRVAKYDFIFALLFVSVFISAFAELLVLGWTGIIIGILIYSSSSLRLPYKNPGKSSTPIIIVLITLVATIILTPKYIMFWLANIIGYSLVYFFSPPKEIVASYLDKKVTNLPLISGGLAYVVFMYLDIPVLGAIISIGLAMYYLYRIHSILSLVEMPISGEAGYQLTRTQTYAIEYNILRGIEPDINPQGTIPELSSQITQMLIRVRHQEENFNLNLKRLNDQYDALTKIIEEDLENQVVNLNEKLESNQISSSDIGRMIRAIATLRSQISKFESERNLLLQTYSQDFEIAIISSIETLLQIVKENHSKIKDSIDSSKIFTVESNLNKLTELETELHSSHQKLLEKEALLHQEFLDKQSELESKREEKIEVKSFKLQALISEKVVSNLFAYIGVAFVIAGTLFFLNYTYENYILKNFPETAPFNDARFGIAILYILSIFIIAVPSWVLNKIGVKFKIISPIFMSIGLLFLQLTLYVQAFYFVNLDLANGTFTIIGTLAVLAAFFISYLWRSQLIGLTATEMGIWLYYISSLNNLINKYFVTLGFLALLLICYWLVYSKELWIPFATISLFTPILWTVIYQNSNNIWLPEYLTLGVAVLNVGITLQKKMPTPKPFSNFLATTSIIYPNFIALQFTVLLPSDTQIESLRGTSSIIIVLTSFFILYWVYVLFEGEINLDFNFPVSYKFREEQLKYQKIEQKLNWLMLTSLLILLVAGLSLVNKGIYQPIIFFAAFLAIMSNVAQIKKFEKYVKNSSLLFIFESQLFYIFNLYNPEAPNLVIAVLTGIFLISFTTNFQLIVKYQSEFNLQRIRFDPTTMGIVIATFSVINYVIGSFSEFEAIVLFVAVLQWLFIIHSMILLKNKTKVTRHFIHIASVSAPITLFIGGLLKQTSKFDQGITLSQLIINTPLILIFVYVIFLAFKGDLLFITKPEKTKSKDQYPWYGSFINSEKIYAPQLLLFILPNILIIYGKPYFFFPEANQAVLILYLVLYFLLLPILFIISERKEEKSFSILSSFWGYFSFLLAFVLLGGAKQAYERIIKPPPSNTPRYIIPLEWAIFLFVVIFVGSISWTLSLSKRFDSLQIEKTLDQKINSSSITSNSDTLEV